MNEKKETYFRTKVEIAEENGSLRAGDDQNDENQK